VKTRNQFTAGRWRDDMPDDVLAQVAWQRLVTGADHVHVAALIGGQRLVEHRYDSDQRLEDYLRERAEEVWDAVRADYPPLVDADAVTAALMDVLFPDRSGEVEVPLAAAAELEDKYLAAAAAYRAAAEAKDEARAAVLSVLAGGDTLTAAGRRLFTYRPTQRRTVDLRKLAKTDPDLAHRLTDGGWVTETTSRTLRYQTRGDTDE
jgi:predicted phage-related endonuclease